MSETEKLIICLAIGFWWVGHCISGLAVKPPQSTSLDDISKELTSLRRAIERAVEKGTTDLRFAVERAIERRPR